MWLATLAALKEKLPDEFMRREEAALKSSFLDLVGGFIASVKSFKNMLIPRFMQKYADFDLVSVADNTVPPIDLNAIGTVRSVLFKYQREVGKLKLGVSVTGLVSS